MSNLNDIDVPVNTPDAKAGDSNIREVQIEGDSIQRYNSASALCKSNEALMKKLKPLLVVPASEEFFEYNTTNAGAPLTSVRLVDQTRHKLNVSFKNAYGNISGDEAIAALTKALTDLGVKDVNKYLRSTLALGLDALPFFHENGDLNVEFYKEVYTELAKIAEKHKVNNPLTALKVVQVRSTFHQERWADFTYEQQKELSKLLPNQISLTPVATPGAKAAAGSENKPASATAATGTPKKGRGK